MIDDKDTLETQEQPQKNKGGRPAGTTKEVMLMRKQIEQEENRRKAQDLENSKKTGKGNHKAVGVNDLNRQLAKEIEDDFIRKETIKSALSYNIGLYKQKPCKTTQEVEDRISLYFETCAQKGVLPTVEGIALSCGVTTATINDWANGVTHPERGIYILRAKQLISELDAQLVSMGKIPATAYIFRSKNFYGMSDRSEVQITNNKIGDLDEAELKRNIEETIIDADFEEVF